MMDKNELKSAFMSLDIDKSDNDLNEIISKYKAGDKDEISKEDFKKVFEPFLFVAMGDIDPDLNLVYKLFDN